MKVKVIRFGPKLWGTDLKWSDESESIGSAGNPSLTRRHAFKTTVNMPWMDLLRSLYRHFGVQNVGCRPAVTQLIWERWGRAAKFLKDVMKTVSKTKLAADMVKTSHADHIAIHRIIHDCETAGLSVCVLGSGRRDIASLGMGILTDPQQPHDTDQSHNELSVEEGNKVHSSESGMRQVSTFLGVNRLLIIFGLRLTLHVNPCQIRNETG